MTGPQALSGDEIAASLSKVLEKKITYENISPEEQAARLDSISTPEWVKTIFLELYEFIREGRLNYTSDDIERILGRKPRSLETFLADHKSVFIE